MSQIAYALSDPGKIRRDNEDAYQLLPQQGLFIVSDGMGGHNAGAVAAKLVVEVLPQMILERVDPISARQGKNISLALRDTLVELSQLVRKEAESEPELKGMGATVILAYRRKSKVYIANMGDSRAYLYSEERLHRLTDDHSVVGMLIQDGEIKPEEARTHPARGIISRYVGMEGIIYPDVKAIKISEGDRLLLCSDGLTGMVPDEVIAEILSANQAPEPASRALVAAANEAGGRDNITVLIAELLR